LAGAEQSQEDLGHEGIGKFSMAINGQNGIPLISFGYSLVQIAYQRPDAPITSFKGIANLV
jgi:hypothetical protein